jgi:hypothetical protein
MSEKIITDYSTDKPVYVEKTEGGKTVIRDYSTNAPTFRVQTVLGDNESEQNNH